jgi:hypothetical protein
MQDLRHRTSGFHSRRKEVVRQISLLPSLLQILTISHLFFVSLLGCESQVQLQESYFSASSFEKSSYNSLGNSPHHANFAHDLTWTPADTEDVHQYLQVQFDRLMRITKVLPEIQAFVARKFSYRKVLRGARETIFAPAKF